jgi:hypothetical protein
MGLLASGIVTSPSKSLDRELAYSLHFYCPAHYRMLFSPNRFPAPWWESENHPTTARFEPLGTTALAGSYGVGVAMTPRTIWAFPQFLGRTRRVSPVGESD